VLLKLAGAQSRLGLKDESAVTLTRALRISPASQEVASSLSMLLQSHRESKPAMLDAIGLQAALNHNGVDYDALSRAAFDYVAEGTALAAVLVGAKRAPGVAARSLVLTSTAKILALPLLHIALSKGVNRRLDLEQLLTEIRRVLLLEAAPSRFADRELLGFVVALIRQCWMNGHIFPVSASEEKALVALSLPARGEGRTAIQPQHGNR
jgi:hypothetical protein